ncbi:hypothetical protein KP79_PYT16818 [Mizuhopecten yessoensis]|uniref:Uncharacterized protein n=1 Tax=Mizuhopecten yessoensis TaxID=6573 RepID=A0A210PUU3_MIZYE|nr:hypothetical protein KP79_PYT16818 [Mizuhopecten yessoensis]
MDIPDPLLLHTGWVEEKLGPFIYVQTILNDYKIGKAYEYFQSGHFQEVYYHSISTASAVFCRPNVHRVVTESEGRLTYSVGLLLQGKSSSKIGYETKTT